MNAKTNTRNPTLLGRGDVPTHRGLSTGKSHAVFLFDKPGAGKSSDIFKLLDAIKAAEKPPRVPGVVHQARSKKGE